MRWPILCAVLVAGLAPACTFNVASLDPRDANLGTEMGGIDLVGNSDDLAQADLRGDAALADLTMPMPDLVDGSPPADATVVTQPTVTGVSPAQGPTTGGTVVTITGANFVAGAAVTFGGKLA